MRWNGDPAPIRYGYGRLDAIGHIYNKTALIADAADQKFNPSDAPVSYPFLWNISQFTRVQWNGIAENKPVTINGKTFDLGALGRNTGEVIGVFADVPDGTGGDVAAPAFSKMMSSALRHYRVPPSGNPEPTFKLKG